MKIEDIKQFSDGIRMLMLCQRNKEGRETNKTDRGGFYRMGVVGAPDIIMVIEGKYIGCELKTGKNRQNIAQIGFQKELEKAGGLYWLIRSTDELLKKLKDLKI